MFGLEINGVRATGYTNKTSNVPKTDNSKPLFATNLNNDGFYPNLKFSPEARIEAEMNNSPFMKSLNELFGI